MRGNTNDIQIMKKPGGSSTWSTWNMWSNYVTTWTDIAIDSNDNCYTIFSSPEVNAAKWTAATQTFTALTTFGSSPLGIMGNTGHPLDTILVNPTATKLIAIVFTSSNAMSNKKQNIYMYISLL